MTRNQWVAVAAVIACGASLLIMGSPARAAAFRWHVLVDKDRAPGFRGWAKPGFPAGWQVKGGVLSKEGSVDDLVTTETYGNFELELEWKIGQGGNSGIFYRGTRQYDHIYWSAPEYQLLDDANAPDGKSPLTSAASAYTLYAAPGGVVRPFGQWNQTRIVVQGTHVEHWLNGQKVVDYELKSPDWTAKVAAGKFAPYPGYGQASSGLIGIQGDHAGALAIRHARVRRLPDR